MDWNGIACGILTGFVAMGIGGLIGNLVFYLVSK